MIRHLLIALVVTSVTAGVAGAPAVALEPTPDVQEIDLAQIQSWGYRDAWGEGLYVSNEVGMRRGYRLTAGAAASRDCKPSKKVCTRGSVYMTYTTTGRNKYGRWRITSHAVEHYRQTTFGGPVIVGGYPFEAWYQNRKFTHLK